MIFYPTNFSGYFTHNKLFHIQIFISEPQSINLILDLKIIMQKPFVRTT